MAPEYPSSSLAEDVPAASSTVVHEEAPLDEESSYTIIPDGAERGVAGPSEVANMTGGDVVAQSQQTSKNADDEHSDDQLEVSQEKAVHVPLKIANIEPITEPEPPEDQDSGEGKSNSQKRFKPAAALFPKSNKGILCRQYHGGLLTRYLNIQM